MRENSRTPEAAQKETPTALDHFVHMRDALRDARNTPDQEAKVLLQAKARAEAVQMLSRPLGEQDAVRPLLATIMGKHPELARRPQRPISPRRPQS